jgi:hypothetical protein
MKTTALLALLLLAACSSGTSSIPDAGSPPADSGAIAAEDAGPPDLGVLAPDAAVEDAGLSPPRRQLVDLRLFGQMPLDNAVLNPQFDPGAQSWYAIGDLSGGGALLRTQFRELALSPVGLPALLLPTRATDPTDGVLLGTAVATASPLSASVWIGRDVANAAALGAAHPYLILTLAGSGLEQAFDLTPDTNTATRTLDGLGWQKYSGTVAEASVGIITFAVDDPAHLPIYVHAPVVIAARELRQRSPLSAARSLTAKEEKASARMAAWRRRRIGEAPARPEPLLGPELQKAIHRGLGQGRPR